MCIINRQYANEPEFNLDIATQYYRKNQLFKFSHVSSYFHIFMFEQAKKKKKTWFESVAPGNTGLVTASCSGLCSAAGDAELAKDIQL